ncbi:MAG: hypothetical protein U0524_00685 [Candidatus Saccharimonadales bacterium]
MAKSNGVFKTSGWVYFASVMMFLAGLLHAVEGLVALFKENFFVVTPNALIAFNYTTWGWINIVLAIVLLTAAASVLAGGLWGRAVGVIAAVLSIVASMAFLSAYPIWSILVIVVDVLVIHALVVRAEELRK